MGPVLRPSARLARSPDGPRLLGTVARVATEFPELEGRTIRVDLVRSGRRLEGLAFPTRDPPTIALNPSARVAPTLAAVVAHELTHLLQRPYGSVPNGERACDLFAIARCGTKCVGPPSYLEVPVPTRSRWPHWAPLATLLARRAIAERSNGRRHYLKWWEATFRDSVGRAEGANDLFGGVRPVHIY